MQEGIWYSPINVLVGEANNHFDDTAMITL